MSQDMELNELLTIRRNKLNELRELGVDPFGKKYVRTHMARQIIEEYDPKSQEELEALAAEVSLAGRIMQKRSMGKAAFAHIQDLSGKIQIYVRKDAIGDEMFAAYSILDIGDIVGVRGTVFKTKTGETTI